MFLFCVTYNQEQLISESVICPHSYSRECTVNVSVVCHCIDEGQRTKFDVTRPQ